MFWILVLLVVSSQVFVVTSHGGHVDDTRRRADMQDALLSYLCNGANGVQCNGQGTCRRGVCLCYSGYSGVKCETADDDSNIMNEPVTESTIINGSDADTLNLHDLLGISLPDMPLSDSCTETDDQPCNGRGMCHEGVCACNEGYSGLTCELPHNAGFCNTYRECAECVSLMKTCPDHCSNMAKFKLVFGFPIDREGTFKKCRFRYPELNCTIYFKQESEDEQGRITIMVKACLASQNEASSRDNGEAVERSTDRNITPHMTSDRVLPPNANDPSTSDRQDGGDGSGQDRLFMSILTMLSTLVLLQL
ncbi:hypothetical protein ACF0H5_015475 [Mactra antiquata]